MIRLRWMLTKILYWYVTREARFCRFGKNVASTRLLALGLWGTGLLSVLFLLGGFRLFGVLLSLPFGLVLLAFLVAHGITPFWCSSWHVAVSASSGPLWPWSPPSVLGPTYELNVSVLSLLLLKITVTGKVIISIFSDKYNIYFMPWLFNHLVQAERSISFIWHFKMCPDKFKNTVIATTGQAQK